MDCSPLRQSLRRSGGVAVDAHDNLFMADMTQEKIYKIDTASGRVYRVAGNGKAGFDGDGGPARDASFNYVSSIAFGKNGNLLISDGGNCRIRRIQHDTEIIDTIVITEPIEKCTEENRYNVIRPSPSDLVTDSTGNIFFVETAVNLVMRLGTDSTVPSIVAGDGGRGFSGDGGPAFDAALNGPSGLAIDSTGNLFISDVGSNRVRRIDAQTKMIQTIAGNGLPNTIHPQL